jgi:hypothetical protein
MPQAGGRGQTLGVLRRPSSTRVATHVTTSYRLLPLPFAATRVGRAHGSLDGSVERFGPLLEVPELNDLELLLSKLEWIMLFGPGGFRAEVPASVAMEFYKRGDTLYMTKVDEALPGAKALVSDVAMKLGVAPYALAPLRALVTRIIRAGELQLAGRL